MMRIAFQPVTRLVAEKSVMESKHQLPLAWQIFIY
jgi:hypothetical protein